MVCSVGSVEDLYLRIPKSLKLNFPKPSPLERVLTEIIQRRDSVLEMLKFPNYFRKFPAEHLPDQILMINGLVLEASKLDDEYRKLSGNISDPNYKQLDYMLQGIKRVIQKEIRYRQSQEA